MILSTQRYLAHSTLDPRERAATNASSFQKEKGPREILEHDTDEFWDFADLISRKEFGLEVEVRTPPKVE